KRQTHSFAAIASYFFWSPTLTAGRGPTAQAEVLRGRRISADLLPTLGVAPELGRNFSAQEEGPKRGRVVLLSHSFWIKQFGGGRGIVGRTIELDRGAATVVGVLPARLETEPFADVQVWSPEGYDASVPDACRSCQHLHAIGRLAPGATPAAAAAEIRGVQRRLAQAYPNDYPHDAVVAMAPLRESVVGGVRGLLWMLFAATGLVLLIVCANLANLLLARAAERRREMSVRAALGAGRGRILRQLLAEGALLGLLGGALGAGLAWAALRSFGAWAGQELPRMQTLALDGRALLLGLGLSLAAGALIGLAPALQAARLDPGDALHGARGGVGGGSRTRRLLVGAEVALAALLAVGAGLVLKSFVNAARVSPGFDPAHAFTADFILSGPGYASDAAQNNFDLQLLDRLAAAPRIQAAGLVSVLPLDPGNYDTRGYYTLHPAITTQAALLAANAFYDTYFVSPGYFAAMSIPLLEGRYFSGGDMQHPAAAAIVDQSLARKLWPGQRALGQALALASTFAPAPQWARVVGVVADVHQYGLERVPTPEVYLPYPLNPGAAGTLVVRSALPPAQIEAAARGALSSLDASVPLARGRMLDTVIAGALAQRRLTLALIALFGGLALLLAALGIYGVVAYTTAARRSEIGMRLALGADRGGIVRLVVSGGMRPALAGLVLGIAGATAAGRLVAGLLFEVAPADPAILASAALVLGAIALTACALPAWRASRLDPARALRAE
ncbi:MAG: ADOP family duplicated permease, partial [Terriglobales bacterium]